MRFMSPHLRLLFYVLLCVYGHCNCLADGELKDDPHTVQLLIDIGAVSDAMLDYVERREEGYITSLDLFGRDIEAVLPHLDRLSKLVSLRINVEKFSADEVEPLSRLTSLQDLTIECGDEHVYIVRDLTKLKRLQFRSQEIRDSSLRHLSKLKRLESLALEGNPITGQGFEHLDDFDKLRSLHIANTQLNEQGVDNIIAHFPRLSHLTYYDTPVTSEDAYKLSSLLWLMHLSFPNEVVGPDLRTVPKEERAEFTEQMQMRKQEFATEYVRRYQIAKTAAKKQGKEVPPNFLWPFKTLVEVSEEDAASKARQEEEYAIAHDFRTAAGS